MFDNSDKLDPTDLAFAEEIDNQSGDEKKFCQDGKWYTKTEYIIAVKQSLCKMLDIQNGQPCGSNPDCLTEEPRCHKCGRIKGQLSE